MAAPGGDKMGILLISPASAVHTFHTCTHGPYQARHARVRLNILHTPALADPKKNERL